MLFARINDCVDTMRHDASYSYSFSVCSLKTTLYEKCFIWVYCYGILNSLSH